MVKNRKGKKIAVLNDYLTDCQMNLMMHLFYNRASEIIREYFKENLSELSEYDIDDTVIKIKKPKNRVEAELKGYLFAVYDSRKDGPKKKKASHHVGPHQRILISQLQIREPGLFEKCFGNDMSGIEKEDIAIACDEIEKTIERTGNWQGLAVIKGYLLAIRDADVDKREKHNVMSGISKNALKTTSKPSSDNYEEEANGNEVDKAEIQQPDENIHLYEKDDYTSVYEPTIPIDRIRSEGKDEDMEILLNLHKEHFHSILRAIKKEPKRYINIKTGDFKHRKLAKLTVAILDDIRIIHPEFEELISIPGFGKMRSTKLYNSAKRCIKKRSKYR